MFTGDSKVPQSSRNPGFDYSRDVYFSPIFDFSSCLNEQLLPDCRILISEDVNSPVHEIQAHRLILSNSSVFFFNSFTSDLKEAHSGEVPVYADPSLMMKAVKWMYDGLLEYDVVEIVGLIELSEYFGIRQLQELLESELSTISDKEILSLLVTRCFEDRLPYPLTLLEPGLSECFNDFDISELTNILDVGTFARVIAKTGLGNAERIQKIVEFLGEYKTSLEEKRDLWNSLIKTDPGLKRLLSGQNYDWLPKGTVESLR